VVHSHFQGSSGLCGDHMALGGAARNDRYVTVDMAEDKGRHVVKLDRLSVHSRQDCTPAWSQKHK
jgi:hypothetical protein